MSDLTLEALQSALKELERQIEGPITVEPQYIIMGPRQYKLRQRRLKRKRNRDKSIERDGYLGYPL